MQTQQTIREKIEEAASRVHGRSPQIKTIAKFINESDNDYRAEVETAHYLKRHSYRSNLRKAYSRSGRTANGLTIWKGHGTTLVKAYEFDPTKSYDTGTDVCRWVVRNIINK